MRDYKAIAASLRASMDPQKRHAADVIDELVRLAGEWRDQHATELVEVRAEREELREMEIERTAELQKACADLAARDAYAGNIAELAASLCDVIENKREFSKVALPNLAKRMRRLLASTPQMGNLPDRDGGFDSRSLAEGGCVRAGSTPADVAGCAGPDGRERPASPTTQERP